MSCTDNKDGSCSVEYIPYEPGTYSLNVTYGGHQVPGERLGGPGGGTGAREAATSPPPTRSRVALPHPGSPFKVPVTDVVDSSKVKCAGPGLTPGVVRANVPQTFTVDTSKAGVAPLDVKVQGPKGQQGGAREVRGTPALGLGGVWGTPEPRVTGLSGIKGALWVLSCPRVVVGSWCTLWGLGVPCSASWGALWGLKAPLGGLRVPMGSCGLLGCPVGRCRESWGASWDIKGFWGAPQGSTGGLGVP